MTRPGVLAHRVDGVGEPVLLLNGGMMSIASWDPVALPLAERYRVVRCDFRGQLCSPGATYPGLDEHVADLAALLDALEIERVHVIGTSFGGEVGLLLAATHPARVVSLVAATVTDVATPALRDGGGVLARLCREAAEGGSKPAVAAMLTPLFYSPAYVAAHLAELSSRAAQVALLPDWWFARAADLLDSIADLDLRPVLGRIACPALIVAAAEDRVMPVERSQALAAAVPYARLEVVEGSGHVLVAERTDEFVAICLNFLDAVCGLDERDARAGDRSGARTR